MEITLKITKKRIIVGVAVIAAAGMMAGFIRMGGGTGGGMSGGSGSASASSSALKTVTLERRDLASTISATGIIYSREATNVYSGLNYTVSEITVSVGDKVKEGDVLARLDSSSLESEIAQKEASAGSSYAKAQQTLTEAQRELSNYQRDSENGYDSSMNNAKTSVTSAENAVKSAELDVESAQLDLQTARHELRDANNGDGKYLSEEATDSEKSSLKAAVVKAENKVDQANASLQLKKLDLENAKTSYESAKVGSGDTLASYKDKVTSAQLSLNMNDQWLAIENLKSDLEKCAITAPVSGTVTAENAVQGAGASGVLFVIQDDSSLKIITEIAEYDVGNMSIGDKVLITTEASGDTEFEGALSKIAPTTTLTATGESATSTDAVFESEVTVKSSGSQLRIGMNASLRIVTDERKDVFAVPFEAVTTERGQAYVFAAELQEDGTYTAKKIAVTQGIETDVYVEVSGDDLSEGMIIIKNATGITEGQKLEITVAAPGNRTGTTTDRETPADMPTDGGPPDRSMGGDMPMGGGPGMGG